MVLQLNPLDLPMVLQLNPLDRPMVLQLNLQDLLMEFQPSPQAVAMQVPVKVQDPVMGPQLQTLILEEREGEMEEAEGRMVGREVDGMEAEGRMVEGMEVELQRLTWVQLQ